MNYRHLFHAGNFADVLKHALLLEMIAALKADGASLAVLDTHAGAGLYDLADERARMAGEAEAGVGRLMRDPAPPPPLLRLQAAVAGYNDEGRLRWLPGSPLLAVGALGTGDAWTGCEIRPDDAAALRRSLGAPPGVAVQVRETDGYAAVRSAPAEARHRRLVLIDPPFERGDEADRIGAALDSLLRGPAPAPAVAVWAPLKDLDGYDRLLGRVEALRPPPSLAVQVRLRALSDPLRLNGCVMLLVGGPDVSSAAAETAAWVAAGSAEPGAGARVERFGR